MKKITKIQFVTIILIILYSVWEVRMRIWESTLPKWDPVIRVDLVIIYPILGFLIVLSIIQIVKGINNKK